MQWVKYFVVVCFVNKGVILSFVFIVSLGSGLGLPDYYPKPKKAQATISYLMCLSVNKLYK